MLSYQMNDSGNILQHSQKYLLTNRDSLLVIETSSIDTAVRASNEFLQIWTTGVKGTEVEPTLRSAKLYFKHKIRPYRNRDEKNWLLEKPFVGDVKCIDTSDGIVKT